MIKFHIPGLEQHYELNIALINLLNEHPEYFYDNIKIDGVYGTFGPNKWAGGRQNIFFTDLSKKRNIIQSINNFGISVIYVFTNSLIEQEDLYDYYTEEDLQIAHNKLNKIVIVSDILMSYIKDKYPDYKFISSITSDSSNDLKSINNDKFDINVVNANLNHTEELFNISNKDKIELLVNTQCIKNCSLEKEHYENISKIILNKPVEFFDCPYDANHTNKLKDLMTRENFISVEDLYNKYVPAGFEIFKINGRNALDKDILEYYLYYMVKPEHKEIVENILKEYVKEF